MTFIIKPYVFFRRLSGFTLIELMVTIAIVGILAAVAIPSYTSYMARSRFTEMVRAADSVKTSVATCAQITGALTNCSSGSNGIPTPQTTQNMTAFTITSGVITATGTVSGQSYTYILTPTFTGGNTTWVASGTCVAAGLC
ncbi:MAG: prepilin-type N-terminal cleavage/methylation domain-containing protein [Gammaproteobacteria bacterium]|nr:prepilin-type N-terminal cleavage/methylation domain-containing protein [Gammaproteobacteria bacterium]